MVDQPIRPNPRFRVGDLVSCAYDLFQYYRHLLPVDDDDDQYSIAGIIVEVEYAMYSGDTSNLLLSDTTMYSEVFGYEILYVILCLDGKHRYFAEDELSIYP